MKIGIIGTGFFSVGIAINLAENKENKIVLWSENKELVDEFQKTRKIKGIYEKALPKNIDIVNVLTDVIDNSKVIFILSSINFVEEICINIKDILSSDIPVVIGTKGINEMGRFAYEIANKELDNNISLLSGPTFAEDLMEKSLVGFNLYAKNKNIFKEIKDLFNPKTTIIKYTKDLKGLEISGVLKNIYAIGSGIMSNISNSTTGLYLSYVFNEMYDILYKINSDFETLIGLGCLGDLIITCTNTNSRNFTYGTLIKNKNKKELEKYLASNTVEGYKSLPNLYNLLKKKRIKTPILDAIYDIVINGEDKDLLISTIINY